MTDNPMAQKLREAFEPGESEVVDAEVAYIEKFDEHPPTAILPRNEEDYVEILREAVSDEVRITEDSLRDHWEWDIPDDAVL